MLTILFCYYCGIALLVLGIWLTLFLSKETASKSDRLCWLTLMIGSLAWIIVLPIASLEITYNYYLKRVN